jgi:hypothetical protein
VNGARLCAFLIDSLALWSVEGTVEAGEAPALVVIRADGGAVIRIEPLSEPEMPFRWLVRDARDGRPRPCGSLVGVLNAVRGALGVDRGSAVRIAK